MSLTFLRSTKVSLGLTTLSLCLLTTYSYASEEAHGEVEGHAQPEGLPQLDVTTYTSQIFWLVITFAVLYLVLSRKILPDLSSVIENRKNHIESDLETAEKLTAEADDVHDAYQKSLDKAQEDAAEAIKKVENKAKLKTEDALKDFAHKSSLELKDAEKRIEDSKIAAMADMNQIAVHAAAQAVEKIIGVPPENSKIQTVVENMNGKAKAA